jgi:hypothetical protein
MLARETPMLKIIVRYFVMDWLVNMIVKWILEQVKNGTIEAIADKAKAVVLPWLRDRKDELIARLKEEARKTGTPIDDAFVDWIDIFIEAWIPDSPVTLAQVPPLPEKYCQPGDAACQTSIA